MAKPAESKQELQSLAERLTTFFGASGDGQERLRKRLEGRGMMFPPQIMMELEAVQCEAFAEWGFDPRPTLANLQGSVRKYPDIKPAIVSLCDTEEKLMDTVMEEVAKANNVDLEMLRRQAAGAAGHGGHGHSHGGHGHSHGGHGHSHGGHGHSHGGQGGHGHSHGPPEPGTVIKQHLAMMLVQRSMSDDQVQFMDKLRLKMKVGQMPTPEEQQQAMVIQQRVMGKMSQMGPLVMSGWDAFDDDEKDALLKLEKKMLSGAPMAEEDKGLLEESRDSLATYIATMGPMLAQMRQQQQQAGTGAAAPAPAAQTEEGSADKKKD